MEKEKNIKWEKLSNKKLKENLVSLRHEHIALKDKIDKLLAHLEDIEKEYYLGNTILTKRYKGVE